MVNEKISDFRSPGWEVNKVCTPPHSPRHTHSPGHRSSTAPTPQVNRSHPTAPPTAPIAQCPPTTRHRRLRSCSSTRCPARSTAAQSQHSAQRASRRGAVAARRPPHRDDGGKEDQTRPPRRGKEATEKADWIDIYTYRIGASIGDL